MGARVSAAAYGTTPPGFFRRAWAVLVGCLVAFVYLLPVWVLCSVLGLVWRSGVTGGDPPGLENRPYLANGAWANSADIAAACLVLAFAAICVASSIKKRVGVAVSTPTVFLFLVGGYIVARAASGVGATVGLLLAAAAISLAITHMPARYLSWRPRPSRRLAVLAAVGVGVVWISYPLTHPLGYQWSTSPSEQANDLQNGFTTLSGRPGTMHHFSVTVQNAGYMRPVVSGASLQISGPHVVQLVTVRAGILAPLSHTAPLPGLALPTHSNRNISFIVRMLGCNGQHGTTVISRIVLHYRLLGAAFTQPIAVRPAPTVYCP